MLKRIWGPNPPAGGGGSGGGSGGGGGGIPARAVRIVLAPPDFQVNPSVLIDSHLEWPVRVLGYLTGVRSNRDVSNRAYLLRLVDSIERGARGSQSPAPVDALLSLSVSGLRLERRLPPPASAVAATAATAAAAVSPEVLLRVPVSQLLSVAYVRDADRHVIALHHGPAGISSQLCALVAHARIHAQEICAIARQLLQLAYTEATLDFFDRALGGSAPSASSALSTSAESNSTPITSAASSPVLGKRDSPQEGVSSLAASLGASLARPELIQFGQLFRAWSSGGATFATVRPQLERLFPQERSHLLLGLRPFIPVRDQPGFDDFLRDRGLRPSGYSRSVSVNSTTSSLRSHDSAELDLDQALSSIVAQVQSLEQQQQFLFSSPSYSRGPSSVASSQATARQHSRQHQQQQHEAEAAMFLPDDAGRSPVNELSPLGHAHKF